MPTCPATSVVTRRLSVIRSRFAIGADPGLRCIAGVALALCGLLAANVVQAADCTSGAIISASTSCDIPTNTPYTIEAWGAGGGGGSRSSGGAGGGGGGAYCMVTSLAIGSPIALTVGIGSGGTGGGGGDAFGATGGNTTVTGTGITLTAFGGSGGQNTGTGGAGGSTSACTADGGVGYAGGNGGTGASPSDFPGGGGGGGSAGATGDGSVGGTGTSAAQGSGGSGDGAGGNGGRDAAASAQAGNAPGGGGGGGSDLGAQGPGAGGGTGQVKVTFTQTPLFSALSPASGSYMNAYGTLGYSLSIAAAAGNIAFTRTGGTADAGSPRVCTYQGTAVNSGAHTLGLTANANGCTAPLNLVDGAIYAIRFFASNSNVEGTVSRYDNAVTGITYDITPPGVAGSTPIVLTDSDARGTLNAGDTIVLTFSEPVLASNITLGNLAVNNGHTLSTSNVAANTPSGGYATSFTITLAGTPTLAVGDTLTITSANVVDRAGNAATANAVFTVPAFAPGYPTGGVFGTAGNGQVSLSWTAPAGNGGAAITGYRVQVAMSWVGAYADAAGTCAFATTSISPGVTCTATGLTNGTEYSFKVAAVNSAGTGSYSAGSAGVIPVAAVNGACATIAATAFAPTTGLCTQGTAPSSATPGSPWTWSCTGSGGGTTASCSAPNASTATGSGTGRASISGGSWVVEAANSGFVASSTVPSLPPGTTFPHGLLNLRLITGSAGSSATVVITYPSTLPAGTVYWKYGRTASNTTAHWYQFAGAAIAGSTITLTLTDGADGDDDMTANSVITDPGGPGAPASTTVEPIVPEVPVVPLIPPLASLPALPGVGNSGRVFLNLGEGAGPVMTGCLRTTLNDLLGPDWLYQGQSADGGSKLSRATEIISFYPIEANTNTTYGLGQGAGIYLRTTNPLSVVTGCGTFLTAPALYNLGEFGALLNAAGQTAQINAQGVITYPTGTLTYAVRPGYWVTQGTPAAPALTTGADGQLRFTDSAGHSQILYPAFLDPELLGTQVSQAVGGWTVIQTDGTALLTLFGGQQFVLTPDLALGSVPPGTMTVWWQDGPNHFSYRNSGFSNTSQGFSVSPR